nr:MAG TPA: hypothetical protein [Bacteriophage sp.]
MITLKIYFPTDIHLLSNLGVSFTDYANLAFFISILVSRLLIIRSPPHNSI